MARAGRGRRWARVAGYALFFAVAFLVFLWREIPYPELARSAEAHLRARGIEAEIRHLGPGPFPGVRAASVRLKLPAPLDTPVELADVRVQAALGSLVRARPVVELRAAALGGTLDARVTFRKALGLETSWQTLDLSRIPKPPRFRELPLAGTATGELRVRDLRAAFPKAQGSLDARFEGVRIGPGKAAGLPVPEVALGNGQIRVEVAGGKAQIREARFEGGDLEIALSNASVLLRQPLRRSLVNGMISVSPTEKARRELALLFAVFPGNPGSDGRYTGRIRGNLGSLRLLRR